MLTMALAGRIVTGWTGDPAAVRSYGVRFTRPVVVPDDDEGAQVDITGKVTELTEADGAIIAKVAITATFDGKTVLGRAVAEVAVSA
jgi:acyl dehydratase